MKTGSQVLVLLALTALAATATQLFHPRAPAWHVVSEPMHDEDVTLSTVGQRWHNNVLWVDARPRDQYAAAHAPGALLINEQEADSLLAENMEALTTTQKPIVIYCSSDSCEAARKMREYILQRIPLEQIYVLHGGWKELEGHVAEMHAQPH
jgi:rhodanese-related sulfurtransferase